VTDWDRNAELQQLQQRNLAGSNLIIAKMWIYHRDLEFQAWKYANAKTYYERTKATLMTSMMVPDGEGKKLSAAAAEQFADADPDLWKAALGYRLAEQMTSANKEALKILHGELDAFRTKQADERAADSFLTRTQT
jgi:hypothetical protein